MDQQTPAAIAERLSSRPSRMQVGGFYVLTMLAIAMPVYFGVVVARPLIADEPLIGLGFGAGLVWVGYSQREWLSQWYRTQYTLTRPSDWNGRLTRYDVVTAGALCGVFLAAAQGIGFEYVGISSLQGDTQTGAIYIAIVWCSACGSFAYKTRIWLRKKVSQQKRVSAVGQAEGESKRSSYSSKGAMTDPGAGNRYQPTSTQPDRTGAVSTRGRSAQQNSDRRDGGDVVEAAAPTNTSRVQGREEAETDQGSNSYSNSKHEAGDGEMREVEGSEVKTNRGGPSNTPAATTWERGRTIPDLPEDPSETQPSSNPTPGYIGRPPEDPEAIDHPLVNPSPDRETLISAFRGEFSEDMEWSETDAPIQVEKFATWCSLDANIQEGDIWIIPRMEEGMDQAVRTLPRPASGDPDFVCRTEDLHWQYVRSN